jgi:hypothetical protein
MTKTMHEQMEEIEKERKKIKLQPYKLTGADLYYAGLCGREDQLQTDMKIVEELKEKLKNELFIAGKYHKDTGSGEILVRGEVIKIIDKIWKESVGR